MGFPPHAVAPSLEGGDLIGELGTTAGHRSRWSARDCGSKPMSKRVPSNNLPSRARQVELELRLTKTEVITSSRRHLLRRRSTRVSIVIGLMALATGATGLYALLDLVLGQGLAQVGHEMPKDERAV
jgi:hypothetical protein